MLFRLSLTWAKLLATNVVTYDKRQEKRRMITRDVSADTVNFYFFWTRASLTTNLRRVFDRRTVTYRDFAKPVDPSVWLAKLKLEQLPFLRSFSRRLTCQPRVWIMHGLWNSNELSKCSSQCFATTTKVIETTTCINFPSHRNVDRLSLQNHEKNHFNQSIHFFFLNTILYYDDIYYTT